MPRSSNPHREIRQRNDVAVQKIFHRARHSPATPSTHSVSDGRTHADRTADEYGHRHRHHSRGGSSAAALVGGATLHGSAQPQRWQHVSSRDGPTGSSLDVPLHIGQQLALAAEMGTLTDAQYRNELQRMGPGGGSARPLASSGDDSADAARARASCFEMRRQVAAHARAVAAPPSPPQSPQAAYAAQREAYRHHRAVARYEGTIPRRRALDGYTQRTAAEEDTRRGVPNQYTAARLAERYGGGWPLDNPHRQAMARGEPAMTRVMRGEYYHDPSKTIVRHARNIVKANKRDVRVASEVNRAMRGQPACFGSAR